MAYTINIEYRTGDSFELHITKQNIDFTWENLDIAKQNLQRIKEHYELYDNIERTFHPSLRVDFDKLLEENRTKSWFVKGGKFTDWEYCIKLLSDDGKEFQIHTFWTGYFESLISAEIIHVKIEDDGLKIRF